MKQVSAYQFKNAALCYAVCMIEMPGLVWGETIGLHAHSTQIIVPPLKEPDCYSPYMGGDLALRLLERLKFKFKWWPASKQWVAQQLHYGPDYGSSGLVMYSALGKTMVEAGLRCYVATKADERGRVLVPDELVTP